MLESYHQYSTIEGPKLSEPEPIGEVEKEYQSQARLILARSDKVMEAWQVANALGRLNDMLDPEDVERDIAFRAAQLAVVHDFIDKMGKEFIDAQKRVLNDQKARDETQDREQRAVRSGETQKKAPEGAVPSSPTMIGSNGISFVNSGTIAYEAI